MLDFIESNLSVVAALLVLFGAFLAGRSWEAGVCKLEWNQIEEEWVAIGREWKILYREKEARRAVTGGEDRDPTSRGTDGGGAQA